jgi:hypothetical protein
METEQIVSSIEERIQTLSSEIARLESARAALSGVSSARLSAAAPATAGGTAPRRRRRSAWISAEQIQQALAGAGEVTTTTLIDQTGASRVRLLELLRELETAGKVKRTGEKRGTRWSELTEDDWVTRRAAELGARVTTSQTPAASAAAEAAANSR